MLLRLSILAIVIAAAFSTSSHAADKITYQTHVKPILREHCFACHSQDDASADLALDSLDSLLSGGAGGEVLVAGDPDASRLWKLVTHQEAPKMPPGDKLPQAELDVLKKWIAGGLLGDVNSKPLKSKKPAIQKVDRSKLGKPVGEPAMPTELFHQPVVWTPQPGPVEALATSPWAPLVAIGWQRQVSFYHTDTRELLGIVPYVDGLPKVVRFSRDGSLLLVAGGRHAAAGSASLLDVKTGARLATLGDELDIVLAADISPDLSLVAIGGPKKKVRVYRVADGELAYQISKHTDWITAISFSPDGKFLATADRNAGALIWQAAAGHERADLRGHQGPITSLDWRADAAMLASASEDGTVRLWNPKGKQIKSINAHKPGVQSVRFAQNGNWVTAGRDQKVRTWKPDGAAIADLGKMQDLALSAAFTHDGNHVIATDYSGQVRLIDPAKKKEFAKLLANPKRLATRLLAANEKLTNTKRKLQKQQKRVKSTLAQLELGKADHQTHQSKLAKANTSLAEKRKLYEQAVAFVKQQQQKLTKAKTSTENATASLDQARTALEQAEANVQANDETTEGESQPTDEFAELNSKVELALQQQKTAQQHQATAKQTVKASMEKQTAAQKEIEAAETLLAQVSNETAGLPDLGKLTDQHAQAVAEHAEAEKQQKQAQQTQASIVKQQARFAAATKQFEEKLTAQQTTGQQLAEQSAAIETQHQKASNDLAAHNSQLSKVAQQLKALQAQLQQLRTQADKLKVNEQNLAEQLLQVQTKLTTSEQQSDLLQQSQRDFEAAQQLRKKYLEQE